jgi:hypothetical protein
MKQNAFFILHTTHARTTAMPSSQELRGARRAAVKTNGLARSQVVVPQLVFGASGHPAADHANPLAYSASTLASAAIAWQMHRLKRVKVPNLSAGN